MKGAPQLILITGGKGRLGAALARILPAQSVDRDVLDITDASAVKIFLKKNRFDIVIHCAAYTDVASAEKNKQACYSTNVIGTENLVRNFKGQKFVYLSTDYVFDGERGNYREDDTPNPVNYYALTKLLGEMVVRQYSPTLVIRTSFKPDGPWPYEKAFVDQWTSADYVSKRAPDIARAALMPNLFGIIHIGGERKTVYDLAKKKSPQVGEISLADIGTKLPRDVSLDSSRWRALLKNNP